MDAEEAHQLLNEILTEGLEFIDWGQVHDPAGDVVEGFALAGRWTATVAAAKAGKSILLIAMSAELSEGRDPWSGEEREPLDVVYIDTEMGRVDIEQRLNDCGYEPSQLKRWHACEIPPRLDTPEGGRSVMASVVEHDARLIVIDGLNGVVSGAEKDDTPWRDLYQHTIRPLKIASASVVSADNHGKDETLGPRGSSVKLDKADAIIRITRSEGGVTLRATHRRTGDYHERIDLDVTGLDGSVPVRYRRHGGTVWPDGTARVAALLDELGVPLDAGRPSVRRTLREMAEGAVDNERYRARNDVLGAAIRWRKRENMRTKITVIQVGDSAKNEGLGDPSVDSGPASPLPGGTCPGDNGDMGAEWVGRGVGVDRRDTPPSTLPDPGDPGVF